MEFNQESQHLNQFNPSYSFLFASRDGELLSAYVYRAESGYASVSSLSQVDSNTSLSRSRFCSQSSIFLQAPPNFSTFKAHVKSENVKPLVSGPWSSQVGTWVEGCLPTQETKKLRVQALGWGRFAGEGNGRKLTPVFSWNIPWTEA